MVNLKGCLVVGLREMDAGKTTLARALIRFLREKGLSVCGFKPRAANSIWYDYDVVYEALSQGRLYGKDSKLLKKASGTHLSEEVISPVHRLWAAPLQSVGTRLSEVPHFIADRMTLCDGEERDIVIFNDALSLNHGGERLVENLCRRAARVYHVSNLEELNKIWNRHHNEAIESAHEKIAEENAAIVYESYCNIALPWQGIDDLSLVLAVEPGRVYSYDPDKYMSAVDLLTNIRAEVKANKACELLRPIKTVGIPPFRSNQVVERLKERMPSIAV